MLSVLKRLLDLLFLTDLQRYTRLFLKDFDILKPVATEWTLILEGARVYLQPNWVNKGTFCHKLLDSKGSLRNLERCDDEGTNCRGQSSSLFCSQLQATSSKFHHKTTDLLFGLFWTNKNPHVGFVPIISAEWRRIAFFQNLLRFLDPFWTVYATVKDAVEIIPGTL